MDCSTVSLYLRIQRGRGGLEAEEGADEADFPRAGGSPTCVRRVRGVDGQHALAVDSRAAS